MAVRDSDMRSYRRTDEQSLREQTFGSTLMRHSYLCNPATRQERRKLCPASEVAAACGQTAAAARVDLDQLRVGPAQVAGERALFQIIPEQPMTTEDVAEPE
jgi:hypothetical protein